MIRSGLFAKEDAEREHAVALLGVHVSAEILAGHACATVRQRYRNDEAKPVEAVYTFPLPTKAVLTAFSMTVAGRVLEGEVHEREEAFRRYDDAITRGDGGALLEQERPNVFTVNVGNLLPGEETVIEIRYVEPVLADEGAVRWAVPTLVAPRYIPGVHSGDRTAHGMADPTDRVPDADRISPPIADVAYGLSLDLTVDLGVDVDVESPSHAVVVTRDGKRARVSFAQNEVPLDRDVVVTAVARAAGAATTPIAAAVSHRTKAGGGVGAFALTIVPDLGVGQDKQARTGSDVVFVLDRSGSMGGSSMPEARTALKLCLRQLREGDRFAILAFDDTVESFATTMVPFTEATLQRADRWLSTVDARGGTELLAPMLEAAKLAPDGLVVLLTDGAVGNEDEVLAGFVAARKGARVYSFGIGTNVSDALLQALAEKTGGAVEMIYPGERLDEKVVAQFARATAPRVTDITIKARGVDLAEIAPAVPRPLVDGEPYSVFGTYEQPGRGAVEIRGKLRGEPFYLEVPVDLAEECDRPMIAKLWAQARIHDLEASAVTGRRADTMKDRIVKLAVQHGVSSKYTSFLVVEKRTGDRRATEQPETRVVPVNAPSGWSMFRRQASRSRAYGALQPGAAAAMPMPAPARAMARPMAAMSMPLAGARATLAGGAPPLTTLAQRASGGFEPPPGPRGAPSDPVVELLARQSASGLWETPGRDSTAETVDALLAVLRLGVTTAHPVFGAQIKKAVDALVALVAVRAASASRPDARLAELAFGVAWLLATGRRTRDGIAEAAQRAGVGSLGSEPSVRARVDQLSAAAP
jgi:Ca-activated chloride channel family protein